MAYKKQNFVDGAVLTAAQLNNIEDGLYEVSKKLEEEIPAAPWITWISIPAAAWEGADSLYSQVVRIDGVTPNSKVDLLPTVEQLAIFYNKDVTFLTENEGGVVTVYAIGEKPLMDYTMQAQIMEVAV